MSLTFVFKGILFPGHWKSSDSYVLSDEFINKFCFNLTPFFEDLFHHLIVHFKAFTHHFYCMEFLYSSSSISLVMFSTLLLYN